ncbi:MAG: trigger factor, partial [Firmicutes bacterium]|nr:trigger factor [Bacillota bacterium]
IYPVEDPKVDLETLDKNGIKYSIEFAIKPEVSLGAYKDLTVEWEEIKVSDEDTEAEIKRAQGRLVREVEKSDKEAAKIGDAVKIDYSGAINGKVFEGGTAKDHKLILGSNSFIPGFEEGVVGMKKGDLRDIPLSFPADYHSKDLAGKEVIFRVRVNQVLKIELPQINDELAKDASNFDTLAEWKADIGKKIADSAKKREKVEKENALVKKVVENADLEIPQGMIDTEIQYMLNDFAQQLHYRYNGLKLDDYFKMTKTGVEEFKSEHLDQAEKNVRTRLVLEEIIKKEKLEIEQDELDGEIAKRADGAKKTVEEYKKDLDEGFLNYIKSTLISDKLMAYLCLVNKFELKK